MSMLTAPLVKATIDRDALGANWPYGIVQLIEAHEKKYVDLVTRRGIHVLLDRYVAEYLPGQKVEWGDKRIIIRTLQSRYFYRFKLYWAERTSQLTRAALSSEQTGQTILPEQG